VGRWINARRWIATFVAGFAFAPLVGVLAPPVLAPPMVAGAQAGEPTIRPIVTTGETNLRQEPGTDSQVLTLIPKGTTVAVGDCRKGWCRVSWDGQDGYAVARNLGIAAIPQWPPTAFAAWQSDDHGPWNKVRKPADRHEEGDADRVVILELGTAGEWPLGGERPNFGGTIAAEIEPIENWLELEFGLTTLATAGHTELSGDLLFKKPFRLSPTVEFMVGAGPSLSHTLNGPERGTSVSAEFALDFMFWPTKNIGWFVEPTWSVNPRNGQQSAAVSLGMLIGFSKP
jgi:hypothetical protein